MGLEFFTIVTGTGIKLIAVITEWLGMKFSVVV
jgi:hypothetical protein